MIDTTHAITQYNGTKLDNVHNQNLNGLNDKRLKEVTDQFEAIFVKQLLDVSLNEKNSLFPDVTGKGIYQSMYNDTMSTQFNGTFGFSEMLFNYLKENR
jgi:Rod binding domain-containing protein